MKVNKYNKCSGGGGGGSYDEGYVQGKIDGVNEQKSKLEAISITENGTYNKEDGYNHIEVNVPDLNGSYEQGKTDGVNEQKSKLESISITENGTYTKEDGYNQIEVNVNAIPKINVKEAGIKFSDSTFTEVPEWADFNGITDMNSMFSNCTNLQTIPQIDTSNVINMRAIFHNCINLQTIPSLNTSNVTNMQEMFSECNSLQTIPSLDTSKVTNMNNMFNQCFSLTSIPALNAHILYVPSHSGVFGFNDLRNITDFGGLLNLKYSLETDYNFKKLPNLTYESCINVLNGLYDFTGNGETPDSSQGKLKVHQNFLDKVGEEISIGTNKGWTITA